MYSTSCIYKHIYWELSKDKVGNQLLKATIITVNTHSTIDTDKWVLNMKSMCPKIQKPPKLTAKNNEFMHNTKGVLN